MAQCVSQCMGQSIQCMAQYSMLSGMAGHRKNLSSKEHSWSNRRNSLSNIQGGQKVVQCKRLGFLLSL